MSCGIEVEGASQPVILGAEALSRWQEWIAWPGYNVAARDVAWGGFAFGRHLPGGWNAGNLTNPWIILGNQAPFFRVINDLQVLDVFSIAGAIGAQECAQVFRGGLNNTGWGLEFAYNYPPILESAPGVEKQLACSVQAWMRKRLAGDATHSAQFIGFVNNNGDLNRSSRVARIGLMGDGVQGFRFGSLNCPNAVANGGLDNVQAAIDAGSFQPNVLVNPAALWFHIRVKMIPAIEGQTGRVGCYLNGRLVKTFPLAANMPRTSLSGIDVSGAEYWPLTPCFAMFGNGGAAVTPGYYLRDVRVRLEEDVNL